jgi:RimJ/RimL family protein N-acetyltransferase
LAHPDPPLRDELELMRPRRRSDVPAIVAAARDPQIRRYSHLPEPFDADAVELRIERMPAELAVGSALRLIIAGADDAPLGAIALFDVARDRATAEIGYWVAAPARGRGLAARAVCLLTGWALETLALGRVLANTDVGNDASVRVLSRCGYAPVGRRRRAGREVLVFERRATHGGAEPEGAPPG